jgi:hypothetical protein
VLGPTSVPTSRTGASITFCEDPRACGALAKRKLVSDDFGRREFRLARRSGRKQHEPYRRSRQTVGRHRRIKTQPDFREHVADMSHLDTKQVRFLRERCHGVEPFDTTRHFSDGRYNVAEQLLRSDLSFWGG